MRHEFYEEQSDTPDLTEFRDDLPETQQAIDLLDATQLNYFQACGQYANKPNQRNLDEVMSATSLNYEAFRISAQALSLSTPLDELPRTLVALLLNQDSSRVDFLNAIVSRNVFLKLNAELDEYVPSGLSADQADELRNMAIEAMANYHCAGLERDTETFMDCVAESPAARKEQLKQEFKTHAIDIGKMALTSIVSGFILRGTLRRKKS